MRRVGLDVSRVMLVAMTVWLAGPAAAEMQPSARPPVEPPASASAPETPAADPAAKDDYYTRRAKSVLEAEKTATDKPHPLAARYPGMDVVVCEAGCFGRKGASVIYVRPKQASVQESREGRMVPTSETGEAAARKQAATSAPVCVAGCYANLAGAFGVSEPEPTWYPSTPPTPVPPRDKLSPLR